MSSQNNKKNKNNKNHSEHCQKTLLNLVGFSCNNKCIMCSISRMQKQYNDRSRGDIIDDLKKGRESGFNSVEFTGGEPTIRREIVDLVKEANDLGYKDIGFSTNGRLFSYNKFCDKIVRAGLTRVTFSLLGADSKVHDAITRTPNSFSQIVLGIKNAIKKESLSVNISTVVSRINFPHLIELGNFISSCGIKEWYLLDLIPDSSARKHYKSLVVTLDELSRGLNSLEKIADNFRELGFFDYPICIFNPGMRSRKNTIFINAKTRDDIQEQVGYNPKRISVNNDGSYSDIYRANIAICKGCQYYKECGGIWRPYLGLYGEEEIIKFAKENKCLT